MHASLFKTHLSFYSLRNILSPFPTNFVGHNSQNYCAESVACYWLSVLTVFVLTRGWRSKLPASWLFPFNGTSTVLKSYFDFKMSGLKKVTRRLLAWSQHVMKFNFKVMRESMNREFKKLRWQLQRKRHIKIELSVKLSLKFHVDHVVQNRRTALSLAWYEWFSCKGKAW